MYMDKEGANHLGTDELDMLHSMPEYARVISWLASWGINPKSDECDEMSLVRAMCEIRRTADQLDAFDTEWYNMDSFGQKVRNDLDRTRDDIRNALAEKVYLREQYASSEVPGDSDDTDNTVELPKLPKDELA